MERDPKAMTAMLLGIPGVRALEIGEVSGEVHVELETVADEATCPSCGAVAEQCGSEVVDRPGLPAFGRPVLLSWRLRQWRCSSSTCSSNPWVEEIPWSAEGGLSRG
ncbi:MAG: Mobile element protein [Acidimicrobiaceae bacterium]|nr:Mobile element protein [Acidimicrobiaceae bacterium]